MKKTKLAELKETKLKDVKVGEIIDYIQALHLSEPVKEWVQITHECNIEFENTTFVNDRIYYSLRVSHKDKLLYRIDLFDKEIVTEFDDDKMDYKLEVINSGGIRILQLKSVEEDK